MSLAGKVLKFTPPLVCNDHLRANFLNFYMNLVVVVNCGAGNKYVLFFLKLYFKCKIGKSAIMQGRTAASYVMNDFQKWRFWG